MADDGRYAAPEVNLMIEFRQRYIGPGMRRFGNITREHWEMSAFWLKFERDQKAFTGVGFHSL